MDGTAVDAIARLAESADTVITAADGMFSRTPLHRLPKEPTADTLKVATLDALVLYLVDNRDALDVERVAIHVESPTAVSIIGPLRELDRSREVLVRATAEDLTPKGHLTLEEFQIALRSRFEPTKHRDELASIFAAVKAEAEVKTTDDGTSQTVTSRSGVVVVSGERTIPSPAELRPFRTFREVEQPLSPFLVRLHKEREITVTLHEVDGGAWRLAAIEALQGYLLKELGADSSAAGVSVLA